MSLIYSLVLVSAVSADDLSRYLYPKTTMSIVKINLSAVKRSGLFDEQLQDASEQFLNSNQQVANLQELLDFDVLNDITGVTICSQGGPRGNRNSLMIVHGRFPYDKINEFLEERVEEGELSSLDVNDLPVYFNHRARQAAYFAVIDHQTVVASPAKSLLEDAVNGLTELREPPESIVESLEWKPEAQERSALFLAGVFPDEARQRMGRVPFLKPIADNLQGFNILVQLGDTTRVEVRLAMADAPAVDQAAGALRMMIGFARQPLQNGEREDLLEVLEGLSIEPDDSDLTVEASIPRELFETIMDRNQDQRERFRERARQREREEAAKERPQS